MTHTPGPWETKKLKTLWHVETTQHGLEVAKAFNKQDASLIAAAPELLEALRGFVWNKNQIKADDPFEGALEKLFALSEAVIAKAEGRDE